ncbi:hypothetical protein ACFE04_010809 [Oxalis oulophora]
MSRVGGVGDSQGGVGAQNNNVEIDSIARFAVDEHNKKECFETLNDYGPFDFRSSLQNKILEFGRVVKAQEQVVSGTMHHLTVEAVDGGTKKHYEAKVWVKPWMNFKELQEFKHVGDA